VVGVADTNTDVIRNRNFGTFDDVEMLLGLARVRASDKRRDEAYFQVDVDSFFRELEAEEPSKFARPDSGSGFILVPERNVLESKLKGLDTDMGQRSDAGARRCGRRGRGLNIHISDIANVNMRRKNIEGGDVEILEDEFDLVVLVLGSFLFEGE